MRIYLIGHGAWAPELGDFVLPPNVTVRFYCRHTSVFDSSWERPLRDGHPVVHRDFLVEEIGGGRPCHNYVLAHPGGIRSTVRYPDMIALAPEAPLTPRDDGFYAVKSRGDDGYWAVSLNSIVNKLRNAGDVTVDWFACREEFADWTGEQFQAWKEVARGMVGRVYG